MKRINLLTLFITTIIVLSSFEIKGINSNYIDGYFYSKLNMYGRWILIEKDIYVWKPTIIHRKWAPYKFGRWVYTDYGWYWDSYEPFGYIVYHYGRWYYDQYYGWIWFPDYQWAPAWVEWRYDNDYIGWAPLPPYAVFRVSIGIVYSYNYVIPITHWHFIKIRYFCDPNPYDYFIADKIKFRVHSNTKYRNDYRYSNGRIRNEGVELDFIRKRTGNNIIKRELIITDEPHDVYRNKSKDQNQIKTFIADKERIISDREKIREANIIRDERNVSLDLTMIELNEDYKGYERVNNINHRKISEQRNKINSHQQRVEGKDDSDKRNRNGIKINLNHIEDENNESNEIRTFDIPNEFNQIETRKPLNILERKRNTENYIYNPGNEKERNNNNWLDFNKARQNDSRIDKGGKIQNDKRYRYDDFRKKNEQRNDKIIIINNATKMDYERTQNSSDIKSTR